MTKTHFNRPNGRIACRLTKGRSTDDPFSVTCSLCKKTTAWFEALAAAQTARKAAFEAQEPRPFAEPWKTGNIVCGNGCGNDLFRYKGRSCHGHYDDYVCSICDHTTSRLTETGMSF